MPECEDLEVQSRARSSYSPNRDDQRNDDGDHESSLFEAEHNFNQLIALLAQNGTVLLREQPFRLIPATLNLYLDETEQTTATFQVYSHGRHVTSPVPVTLSTMSADSGTIALSQSLTTDATRILSIPLTATPNGGIVAFVASPMERISRRTASIHWQHLYVRADAAGRSPDRRVAADVGERLCQRPHELERHGAAHGQLLRPDDPAQVTACGRHQGADRFVGVRELLFMPVTRDMTIGQRTLLYKFLAASAAAGVRAAAPPVLSQLAALSRSQRLRDTHTKPLRIHQPRENGVWILLAITRLLSRDG